MAARAGMATLAAARAKIIKRNINVENGKIINNVIIENEEEVMKYEEISVSKIISVNNSSINNNISEIIIMGISSQRVSKYQYLCIISRK